MDWLSLLTILGAVVLGAVLVRFNQLLELLPWNDYGQRWSVFRVFNIPSATDPGVTYLRRLRIVQTPWFGFYVHWVYLPDKDRDPHDHPWNFWSFVARGGYTEAITDSPEALDNQRIEQHKRFSLHRMSTGRAHAISLLEPRTITVLLVGRRSRDWGFWTAAGWVPWRDYDRSAGHGPDPFMS